jgi:hypothetical protein
MNEIEFGQTVAAQEEYEMTASLFKAMAKAFPEIEAATKDKTNPAFRSKYADLSAVVDAIKPALVKNGLFFAQRTHEQPGGVCIETIVCHESGEQMSFGKLFVPATKQDAQGYGSALTYARRYSLMATFGVPAEDDDGNAAAKSAIKAPDPKSSDTRDVTPERARIIRLVADACIAKQAAGNDYGAFEEAAVITDQEERLLLWDYLKPHSKVRTAIKQQAEMAKQAEMAREAVSA